MTTPRLCPPRGSERVMQRKQVLEMAFEGKISWVQAAEILKLSPRQVRRIRERFKAGGELTLQDGRCGKPSPLRIGDEWRKKVTELYRNEYRDFSVRHFFEMLRSRHAIEVGTYCWVLRVLQAEGLVGRAERRASHRSRRERRPLPGMLIQLDGSDHDWLGAELPRADLLITIDDATNRIHSAEFSGGEGTLSCMRVIREMTEKEGICCAIYVDRASHFVVTPVAGKKPDRTRKTHLQIALDRLGITLIAAYSPQAKGRVERAFRTIQGRLPQELRIEGIRDYVSANRYLTEKFIPWWNENLTVEPKEKNATAFTHLHPGVSLDHIFSIQYPREVNFDNTVQFKTKILQIPKATHLRFSFAGTKVVVHEHTDGTLSITYANHLLARYERTGKPLSLPIPEPMKKTG